MIWSTIGLWSWSKYLQNTDKLGIKKLLNKEQIGFKELFADYQLFYKGQLISKCLLGVIVSTKKPTKFF